MMMMDQIMVDKLGLKTKCRSLGINTDKTQSPVSSPHVPSLQVVFENCHGTSFSSLIQKTV